MHVLYDTQGGTLAVDLDRPEAGVDSVDVTPGLIVVVDDRGEPRSIELFTAEVDVDAALDAVAERWPTLDVAAVRAAARAGLTVPDREIDLAVSASA